MPSLSVAIVDDHTLVRTGLVRLVRDHPHVGSVVEFGTAEAALDYLATHSPHIILIDLGLPGLSGVEAVTAVMQISPQARVIVLTANEDELVSRQLLEQGVDGYLTKDCLADEMLDALSSVLDSNQYVSGKMARRLALGVAEKEADSPFDRLSEREMQIITMILEGKRNNQISFSLNISDKTVSTHRARSFDKLGIRSTAELARLAMQHGVWSGSVTV